MKIIAGRFGGRHLHVPKNRDIRPTSDKIRGAIFNMLEARNAIEGVRVLDMFCGTGALGLEALSRGAQYCCFVDKARTSLSLTEENAEMFGSDKECNFILKNSLSIRKRLKNEMPYHLIFLDPPYEKDLVSQALNVLVDGDWVAPHGWIVCETEKSWDYTSVEHYILDQEKTYGDTKITLIQNI